MVRRAVVALRPVGLPGPVPPFAERKALLLGKKVDILAAGDLATVLQLAPDQTAAEFAVRVHDGLDVIQLPENCRNCNTHKQQPPGLRWTVKSLAQFGLQFNPQQKETAIQTVGEENGGWLRLSVGKAGGHRGIPHGKQGSRRNGVEVVP